MPHMYTWPHWCLESEARCLTAVSDWSTEQRQDLPIFKGITYRLLISAIWSSYRCCHQLRKQLLNQKSSIRADDANRRWSARIVQSRWNLDNHHWKLVYTMLSYACGRWLASVLESSWRRMMESKEAMSVKCIRACHAWGFQEGYGYTSAVDRLDGADKVQSIIYEPLVIKSILGSILQFYWHFCMSC